MSTIEERLERDIAAVTGGVDVTESDLRNARHAVDQRIGSRKQRARRRALAGFAAAAVVIPVLGFAAFSTPGDEQSGPPAGSAPTSPEADDAFLNGTAPTQDLVEGVWRLDNGTVLLRFSSPNLVSIDDQGQLFHDPDMHGTYVIAGDLITVTVSGGPAECAGQTFALRASLPDPGEMRFEQAQYAMNGCTPLLGSLGTLEHVLPMNNAYLADLDNSENPGPWKPPAGRDSMHGDWMAEGGGYVLELARDGAYSLADDSLQLVDRGRWAQQGSELTLTSSTASGACSEGDRLVLSAVEHVDVGTTVMRGTVEENACGGAWASRTWILIPDARS